LTETRNYFVVFWFNKHKGMPSSKIIVVVFTPVEGRCYLDEAKARLSDRETSKSNVKNIIIYHSWITKTTTKYLSVLQSVLRN